MQLDDFFYEHSGVLFALTCFVALIGVGEGCYWLGCRTASRSAGASRDAPGRKTHLAEVGTAIFAVLGLLLAFAFSMAEGRYSHRKVALAEEVNAIEAAYLRTQLLPPEEQPAAKDLLRQYTDARLASARPDWSRDSSLKATTDALRERLFADAAVVARQDPRSVAVMLYVGALNDMIDARGRRDAARLDHLPGAALLAIMAVALMAMGTLGYRGGVENGRSLIGAIVLALLIALLVSMILDLDRPYRGLVTISQQSLIDLRNSMKDGVAGPR